MTNEGNIHMSRPAAPTPDPWRQAAEWVMLSSAGWAVAAWATTTTLNVARELWPPTVPRLAFAGILLASAVAVALAQWIAVRHVTPDLGRWLFASLMGLILAAVVPLPLKLLDWHIGTSRLQWDELLYGLVFGALLGAGQGLALWGRSGRLGLWVVGSALGWALATMLTSLMPATADGSASWLATAVTGAVASLGSGVALIVCLRPATVARPASV